MGTLGFYECEYMPFWLCNAPATFQRLMQNCLRELNYTTCLVYLDDVVIYSSMQEEHLDLLREVLEQFHLNGLKLKPSKCSFFSQEIEYLGHHISAQGIWPSCDKLRAIAEYPEPTTYTSIRGFIGIIGHHRWFIKDFAKIAEPLHDYTRGDLYKKKKESLTLNKEAKEAFNVLKKAVMTAPVLAYPDPNKEYLIEMDVSKLGLEAVLSQKQSDVRYHPVAFGSLALRGAEHKYPSTKLKFLAMKWGIHHLETYLLGRQFKVRMDNNPLTYFMSSPNLDATMHCWIDELVPFTFSLEYQKGKNNEVADTLSRIGEIWLPPEETDAILRPTPLLEGDQTVVKVYNEKEERC